jgi:eukaryotic-like serine/threonine-protein kinase
MSLDATRADASVPAADVRAALARVLRSSPFVRSPQLQRFLSFLVDEILAGRGEQLKEYVIGLEVFARPSSYDPRVDSLVRVEARRLRAALASYYSTEGRSDGVVIELHKGSYVPSFRLSPSGQLAAGSSPPADGSDGATGQEPAVARLAGWRAWDKVRRLRLTTLLLVVAATAAAAIGATRLLRPRPVHALTERDAIVLAGFTNTTGDGVFDETLKQGLATELEQSPFLNIVSERRVGQILKLMGRAGSDRLQRDLARELCLRAGAKAVIAGSIDRLGSQYVIGLTATDCSTGDEFLHVQEAAVRKEAVLRSLSGAASALRRRLGESLVSIQRFGMPVEEATTSSLEALQAYSLGRRTARERGSPADIPFYKRALELDADFAAAHAALGVSYMNQGQPSAGGEHLEKAYVLRDRVSEREKFRISAYYLQAVTGELEKAGEVYELWKQSYPREFAPYANLALAHLWLGEYEKAVTETQEALRLEPANVLPYTNLAALLTKLGRRDEAAGVLAEAAARNLSSTFLRINLCYLAFLAGDASVAERQVAEVLDSPGDEGPLLSLHSDTQAYHGRLRQARLLTRRAVESGLRGAGGEAAATWLLNAALREAEFANPAAARRMVREALALSSGRDAMTVAALAYARSGDVANAGLLLAKLESGHPLNTVIAKYWSPTIRAAIEIGGRQRARALELLQPVEPYELGSPPPMGLATLYPVYLRGEALLQGGNGSAAARQFQVILDHPGLALNFPLHALSHLQLARAHGLTGNRPAALRAYDEFLALWKDADDGPVLRTAQAERRRLR